MSLPKTWKRAIELGRKHYNTKLKCSKGHLSKRFTANRQCVECCLARQRDAYWKDPDSERARLRIRRLADPQKSKDAWARYSKLNRRILNTKSRDHYAANIDAKRERARRDHANNREVNNARSRRYYQENKQKVLVQKTNWLAKHPGYAASVVRNRRALKKGNGGTHTVAEVIAILKKQNYRCVYCNISIRHKRHMDHIKPLSRGGSNNAKNLQGLCPSCNSSKNDKTHAEYVKFLKLRNAA